MMPHTTNKINPGHLGPAAVAILSMRTNPGPGMTHTGHARRGDEYDMHGRKRPRSDQYDYTDGEDADESDQYSSGGEGGRRRTGGYAAMVTDPTDPRAQYLPSNGFRARSRQEVRGEG